MKIYVSILLIFLLGCGAPFEINEPKAKNLSNTQAPGDIMKVKVVFLTFDNGENYQINVDGKEILTGTLIDNGIIKGHGIVSELFEMEQGERTIEVKYIDSKVNGKISKRFDKDTGIKITVSAGEMRITQIPYDEKIGID